MRHTVSSLRKAAIVLVAVYTVVCGVYLVWQLVTRDQVVALSNLHLIGMLALFLLPAATAGAWELDRRSAQRGEAVEALAQTGASELPARERTHAHEPGVERPARHRHRVAAEAVEARR